MPSRPIPLADLDVAISAAVSQINLTKKLKLKPGPIINGIIFAQSALGKNKPAAVAASIAAGVSVPDNVVIKPQTVVLPDKKILLGYILKQKILG